MVHASFDAWHESGGTSAECAKNLPVARTHLINMTKSFPDCLQGLNQSLPFVGLRMSELKLRPPNNYLSDGF